MRTRDDQCCCQGRLGLGLGKAASRVQGGLWLVQPGHVTCSMTSDWSAQPPLSSWRPRLALEAVITRQTRPGWLQWLPVTRVTSVLITSSSVETTPSSAGTWWHAAIMGHYHGQQWQIQWEMRGIGIWSDGLTYELITGNPSIVTSSHRDWYFVS